jgi:hypothetical protein
MSAANADRYQSLLDLSGSQLTALEIIETGGTHAEAANAAGVHRVTVTKWCHHHPAFIAERNRRQIERAERVAVITDTATIRAIEVVSALIDTGDAETAMKWLRLVAPRQFTTNQVRVSHSGQVTAQDVIDAIAETEAMSSPMAVLTDSYRESAITSITRELGE